MSEDIKKETKPDLDGTPRLLRMKSMIYDILNAETQGEREYRWVMEFKKDR